MNIITENSYSLIVKNLYKRYGQNRHVISNMNVHFDPGTATGLMGPNGSGKTTFLRLVSGAAFPTSGEILYNGKSVHDDIHNFLQHVGIVGDTNDLPGFLTANELVEGVMRARGKWTKDSATTVASMFDKIGLDERRDNLISTYSSGMMQKTMIVAAVCSNPKILLLDEPFRALDVEATVALMSLLRLFKNDGGTILISSHHKDILEELCDQYISFPVKE